MKSPLTPKQIYDQERYHEMQALSPRELIDDYYKLSSRRRYTPPRECQFQHPMRIVDYRAWFCDDPLCCALLVGLEIPSLYEMHTGTNFLVFDEDESKKYRAGRQTLREVVLTRIEE